MNQVIGAQQTDGLDEPAAAASAASLFRALGDTSRVAILRHLLLGEHKVVELTEHLGLAQSTVSKHLACLRDCGLVTSRPVGRASVFSVAHADQVLAILAAAEGLLAATGDAVVLCPTAPRAGV
ncbi:metalloregulator ArsR/SmtB family transcription factor [Luteipulveratus sp. YIM 133132]|nr:metalloregulator ArsR/SmtB family transcription factor [Luteipulveratus sp. YIM 133132]MDE9365611.1 metalloregulator ArsR/SmtB family transcription factor [Luteipulveratus sp. YIM 133132]